MDLKHWILILNEPAYADHPASGQVVRTKGAKRRLVEQWQSMAWLGLAWLMTCTLSKVKRKKGRGGQSWWTAIMNVIASGQLFGRSPQLTDQMCVLSQRYRFHRRSNSARGSRHWWRVSIDAHVVSEVSDQVIH